jgi:hypothetical protein
MKAMTRTTFGAPLVFEDVADPAGDPVGRIVLRW